MLSGRTLAQGRQSSRSMKPCISTVYGSALIPKRTTRNVLFQLVLQGDKGKGTSKTGVRDDGEGGVNLSGFERMPLLFLVRLSGELKGRLRVTVYAAAGNKANIVLRAKKWYSR